jgi:hypothetical protein
LATEGLNALIAWARATDFSDPKKATKAIAMVCATARQLKVQTLAQWRAQDYAQTMRNYGILWNGLENLLNIYGLDLAGDLDSADVTATANDGTHATVKLDMKLADQPLGGTWPMVKQAGHWYDANLLEAWRTAHPARAASTDVPSAAASAPAPSITAPAPPAASALPAPSASTHP